ncbi:MAG: MBL fold metallo-hydrolase [Candidatus Helarchaeota archaeon]
MEIVKNIFRISSASPFKYPMNTYFLADTKTCLIDTSIELIPRTLTRELGRIGVSLYNLDYILVSHLHLEHIRSLNYIKKHVPTCQIMTSPLNAEYLEHFEKYIEIARKNLPPEFHEIPKLYNFYYELIDPIKSVSVEKVIEEGDTISLGTYTLEVLETPGHSTGEITFFIADRGIYFSGDLILGEPIETWIAINPFLPNYGGDRRKYLASLQKIAALKDKIHLILPAHGDIIKNPRKKINDLMVLSSEAPRKILTFLKNGGKTLPELVELYFKKNRTKSAKFYNASRMIQKLLDYLLEEQLIKKRGSIFSFK